MNKLSKNIETEIKMNNDGFKTLDSLDLSGGLVCDVETGICGPADVVETDKPMEENMNEDNNLV